MTAKKFKAANLPAIHCLWQKSRRFRHTLTNLMLRSLLKTTICGKISRWRTRLTNFNLNRYRWNGKNIFEKWLDKTNSQVNKLLGRLQLSPLANQFEVGGIPWGLFYQWLLCWPFLALVCLMCSGGPPKKWDKFFATRLLQTRRKGITTCKEFMLPQSHETDGRFYKRHRLNDSLIMALRYQHFLSILHFSVYDYHFTNTEHK